MVSPHTWHSMELHPGVQRHFRVFLAGKTNDVEIWIPSYCALESDNSTCWCKESISLHPILIWINTVPFQVCSWDSGHPRAWVWISFQTLSPWEMKYSIFQAAELAPSGLEFGWRFLFLGLSFSDTYLLCALHKGGLEASFQGLLSIKELSASHKALENPQIFVGSF